MQFFITAAAYSNVIYVIKDSLAVDSRAVANTNIRRNQ